MYWGFLFSASFSFLSRLTLVIKVWDLEQYRTKWNLKFATALKQRFYNLSLVGGSEAIPLQIVWASFRFWLLHFSSHKSVKKLTVSCSDGCCLGDDWERFKTFLCDLLTSVSLCDEKQISRKEWRAFSPSFAALPLRTTLLFGISTFTGPITKPVFTGKCATTFLIFRKQETKCRMHALIFMSSRPFSVGCLNDHFGFSYRGNMSKSASGLQCLSWDNVDMLHIKSDGNSLKIWIQDNNTFATKGKIDFMT